MCGSRTGGSLPTEYLAINCRYEGGDSGRDCRAQTGEGGDSSNRNQCTGNGVLDHGQAFFVLQKCNDKHLHLNYLILVVTKTCFRISPECLVINLSLEAFAATSYRLMPYADVGLHP